MLRLDTLFGFHSTVFMLSGHVDVSEQELPIAIDAHTHTHIYIYMMAFLFVIELYH